MTERLQVLLEKIGAEFDKTLADQGSAIECLGKFAILPPALAERGAEVGQYVWTTNKSWVVFQQAEFESWLVDAPAGRHLLVIERESAGIRISEAPKQIDLVIWNQSDLASIIGTAVIGGKLTLQDAESSNIISELESQEIDEHIEAKEGAESTFYEIIVSHSAELSVAATIDPTTVLDEAGLLGSAIQPALLQTKLWLAVGSLKGPDGQRESKHWIILEDTFSDSIEVVHELNLIESPPALEQLSKPKGRSEEELLSLLPTICDERRHQQITPAGTTKGSLLRWWRLDAQDISLDSRVLLLPCWVVRTPLDGVRIIHGITGSLVRP